MEEGTLLLLAKYHSEISEYTYLLIPDLKEIEFVRDKGNLLRFAEKIGIPTPRTFYVPPSRTLPLEGEGKGSQSPPHSKREESAVLYPSPLGFESQRLVGEGRVRGEVFLLFQFRRWLNHGLAPVPLALSM